MAARSLVQIWNRALGWCRADTVVDPDEDTASARRCRRYYEQSRDAVLRAYPWNCAGARAALSASATAPAFQWAYRYKLPTDFLAVREIYGAATEAYVVEDGYIMTDIAAPLRLVYTKTVTDPARFDPLCADAIAARLAFDMAPELIESATQTEVLEKRYRLVLAEARQVDAAEGRAPEADERLPWIEARS